MPQQILPYVSSKRRFATLLRKSRTRPSNHHVDETLFATPPPQPCVFICTSSFFGVGLHGRVWPLSFRDPVPMAVSVQDRTDEFRSVIAQVQRRHASSSKAGAQRRALLTDAQKREANGAENGEAGGSRRARSDFARKAAEIGRGITGTMAKLERLTQRMFDI